MTRGTFIVAAIVGLGLAGMPRPTVADDGATVYASQCAKCHGETGAADTKTAELLKVKPFKGNGDVASRSMDELITAIKANDKHKNVLKAVSDDQLKAATKHAQGLAGK